MKQRIIGLLVLAFSGLPLVGQDVATKGQVTIAAHEIEMKNGQLYFIKVEAKGFHPQVVMNTGEFGNALPHVQGDFNKPHLFNSHYMATKDQKVTIYVAPAIYSLKGKGPFDYEFEVKSATLAAAPVLDVKDELTALDPAFKADFANRAHHKSFNLKLTANQYYIIDMKAPPQSDLDSYLYLLDSTGKVLRSDDDSGGFPSARIVVQAPKDGDYRIIATGLGQALGKFTLTVRTTEKKF